MALLAARACGARTAAYVHGLDVVAPHPVYRALWLPALRRMDRVIANSAPTAELARKAGVAPSGSPSSTRAWTSLHPTPPRARVFASAGTCRPTRQCCSPWGD
jgi:hypothetical protein